MVTRERLNEILDELTKERELDEELMNFLSDVREEILADAPEDNSAAYETRISELEGEVGSLKEEIRKRFFEKMEDGNDYEDEEEEEEEEEEKTISFME